MSYLIITYFSNKDLKIQSQEEMYEKVKEFWAKTEFEPEFQIEPVPFRGGTSLNIYFNGRYALKIGMIQDEIVQDAYKHHAEKLNFDMTIANEDLYQFGITFASDVDLLFMDEHEKIREFIKFLPERISIDSDEKLLDI